MKKLLSLMIGTVAVMGSVALANSETPEASDAYETLRQFQVPCLLDQKVAFNRQTVIPEMKEYIEQGFKLVGITELSAESRPTPGVSYAPHTCIWTFIRQ